VGRGFVRSALAVATAVVATVLAYPPAGAGLLAFAMLAPIAFAIDGARPRRAFALAWSYSVAMALVLVHWLVDALVGEYGVAALPAWLFTALVVGGLALVPAAAAAAWAALASRVSALGAPLAFAALWSFGEWVRTALLGVPWLLAAHPLARWPLAIQTADLGGAYAVGFLAAATGAGLGLAARRRCALPLALPAAFLAVALAYGFVGDGPPTKLSEEPASGGSFGKDRPRSKLLVGVVQASVPQSQRFQPGSAARNVALHVEATRALAARERLGLVVWSETAVDIDLDETPALRASLEALATSIGVPVLTGAPRSEGGRRTNAVVLFAPGRGLVETYAKQRLVPYSEYDPELGAALAPLLGPVTEGVPYRAGDEPTVFRVPPVSLATPVCFEITYPDLMRRFRERGALLIVNLSNDAWFGRTGYPEMHLAHAVLRAVELRSWVVRSANTGISAAIDPAGRVVAELPAFEQGSFAVEVGPAGPPPLYARRGDAPVLTALALVLTASLRPWRPGAQAGAERARGPGRSAPSKRAARARARGAGSTR
jgi:apolipoprotein N-acyltransferase